MEEQVKKAKFLRKQNQLKNDLGDKFNESDLECTKGFLFYS